MDIQKTNVEAKPMIPDEAKLVAELESLKFNDDYTKSPVEMIETKITEFESSEIEDDNITETSEAKNVIYPVVPEKKNGDANESAESSTLPAQFIPFEKLNNVCFPFQNQGYCLRGSKCKFDHFPPELCPCIEWSQYNCSRGMDCRFAHLDPRPSVPAGLCQKLNKTKNNNKHNNPRFNPNQRIERRGFRQPREKQSRMRNGPISRAQYPPGQFVPARRAPPASYNSPTYGPPAYYQPNSSPSAHPAYYAHQAQALASRRRSLEVMERNILAREAEYYKRQYYDSIGKVALNPNASEFKMNPSNQISKN